MGTIEVVGSPVTDFYSKLKLKLRVYVQAYLDIQGRGEINLRDFCDVLKMVKELYEEGQNADDDADSDAAPDVRSRFSKEEKQSHAVSPRRRRLMRTKLSRSHHNILARAKDADKNMEVV